MAKMTLIEKRDAILESLRCQFATKVQAVTLKNGLVTTGLEKLLLDIANNAAQAIAEDESMMSPYQFVREICFSDGARATLNGLDRWACFAMVWWCIGYEASNEGWL